MGLIHRFEHDGVEGIRVGRFNFGFNTTAIIYRINHTIIDTGPPNQWQILLPFLKEKRLDQTLLTHHHEDHSGNAENISRTLQAKVFAPSKSIQSITNGFPLRFYQRLIWGRPKKFMPAVLPEKIDLEQGIQLATIHAPGHSKDMNCFFEPNRKWLFSSDLFISRSLFYLRNDENLAVLICSLKKILNFDFNTIFCAHRGVVQNGRQAMGEKLRFLQTLCKKSKKLYKEGHDIQSITRKLLGKEDHMSLFTAFHFSKKYLIKSCLKVDDQYID